MKSETKIIATIITLAVISLLSFETLLHRYLRLAVSHIYRTCNQTLTLISSYLRFGDCGSVIAILAGIGGTSFLLLLLTSLSIIKTKRQINSLIKLQVSHLPLRLKKALADTTLPTEQIVVVTHNKPFAFVAGFIHQRIMISTRMINTMSVKQLESILLHEQYHLTHRHSVLLSAARLIKAGLFFLPIFSELVDRLHINIESAADDYATSIQGTNKHVGFALMRLLNQPRMAGVYPGFGDGLIEKRIDALVEGVKEYPIYKTSRILTLVVILFSIFLYMYSPREITAQTEAEQAVCEEKAYQINLLNYSSVTDQTLPHSYSTTKTPVNLVSFPH